MQKRKAILLKYRIIPLVLSAVALLCSCMNTLPEKEKEDREIGGGYEQSKDFVDTLLTVTVRVSSGSARYAMPSMLISDFNYAALLYQDGNTPASPRPEDFAKGTLDEDRIQFSFQRPDVENGLTLEICAFKMDTDVTDFSRENAFLFGKKTGLAIVDKSNEIKITEAILLSVNSSSGAKGTVNLKIKVPTDCSLKIDDTNEDGTTVAESETRFVVTQDENASNVYIVSANEISADAYQLKFIVKKKVGENEEIIHVFSEYINVLNGLCTDTWDGLEKDVAKDVTNSISTTVYVRGTGGWYDSTYDATAVASDDNSGSFLSPFATIQKAVDAIIVRNDGTSDYTIYVDGTIMQSEAKNAYGMVNFSALDKNLTLAIKALSEIKKATLDANELSRVMHANPANGVLNLTLENLVITKASATSLKGGGIYFNSADGSLTMKECTVSGNSAEQGGGIYFDSTDSTFTMKDCTISDNTATNKGGGVYIKGVSSISKGVFTMNGGKIFKNTADVDGGGVSVNNYSEFILEIGEISENEASYGAGVHVSEGGMFTMNSGTISKNIASGKENSGGGGIHLYKGTFNMNGGEISKNEATGTTEDSGGGGIYIYPDSMLIMAGGKIIGNSTTSKGGGVYVNGTFKMSNGEIADNTADSEGTNIYEAKDGNFTHTGGTVQED